MFCSSPGISGRRCLSISRVTYTWYPRVCRWSTHPCRLLRHCWIHSLHNLKRIVIYKIKKFPKNFPQYNVLPPLKLLSHSYPIPLLTDFLRALLSIALALLLSHNVKGGGCFGEFIKNKSRRRSLLRSPHPWRLGVFFFCCCRCYFHYSCVLRFRFDRTLVGWALSFFSFWPWISFLCPWSCVFRLSFSPLLVRLSFRFRLSFSLELVAPSLFIVLAVFLKRVMAESVYAHFNHQSSRGFESSFLLFLCFRFDCCFFRLGCCFVFLSSWLLQGLVVVSTAPLEVGRGLSFRAGCPKVLLLFPGV